MCFKCGEVKDDNEFRSSHRGKRKMCIVCRDNKFTGECFFKFNENVHPLQRNVIKKFIKDNRVLNIADFAEKAGYSWETVKSWEKFNKMNIGDMTALLGNEGLDEIIKEVL